MGHRAGQAALDPESRLTADFLSKLLNVLPYGVSPSPSLLSRRSA